MVAPFSWALLPRWSIPLHLYKPRKPYPGHAATWFHPVPDHCVAESSPSLLPACTARRDSRPPEPRLSWSCTGEGRSGFWGAHSRDCWQRLLPQWRLLPRRRQPLHQRHGRQHQRRRFYSRCIICNLVLSIWDHAIIPMSSLCRRFVLFVYYASLHY